MSTTARILAFAGSTRGESYNKKLIRIAARGVQARGTQVTLIDLRDFPMPLYDGDLQREHGIPEHAMQLKALMLSHHGLLLACPEYNSSISGVLKNAIDWASRQAEGETPLQCFKGKVVSLMSASPGNLGGLRGLVHVRAILSNLGCIVLPGQLAVSKAAAAFDERGELVDPAQRQKIEDLGRATADILAKLLA
jgi:chromate reductase, NAD(P)H dehydrogenase (quinone)